MARLLLVPANSAVLDHETTKVITEYASREVLVSTDAPIIEASEEDKPHGLVLPGISAEAIAGLQAQPLPELETDMLAYVEFAGPIVAEWLDTLHSEGITPRRFQPVSSYLCRGSADAFSKIAMLPFIVSVTPLAPELKRTLRIPEEGEEDTWIILEGSADLEKARTRLGAIEGLEFKGESDITHTYLRIPAAINANARDAVLEHPLVIAIEPRRSVRPEDEIAGLILSGQYDSRGRPNGDYLRWLEDHGINGQGVTIGIVDNGVDETHDAFNTRITTRDTTRRWHGTFVAGHAAGRYLTERDGDGYIYGLGMAPAAELISQDNQKTASALCRETVTTAGPGGANGIVQNNSWGAGTHDPMDYQSLEASYDELVRDADPNSSSRRPLTICFSAGNSGSAGLTRPKAAKNVLVTGNSESYRPSVGNSQSDDIEDVYSGPHGSSYGNCGDGRVRPHIMAPGEWTASANFDSHPGDAEYISPKLTWGGGTSGASPKTAGACALLIQWWNDHNNGVDPSPALLRAMVVNGAEDMNFGGRIPNNRQGWGRFNLANVLSSDVHHTYVDQSVLLRHRGEERRWRIRVSDNSMPLRITLAWTDPPGAIGTGTGTAAAVVNFLGLRVETNGQTYYGNHFSNGWSRAGNLPNPNKEGWDNLQNVYLRAGTAGTTVDVKVRALNITTNCLTGDAANPQQDFALVITNGYLDGGSAPTDLFVVVDDTSAGSGSSVDDHWDSGSSDDDDSDWWDDTSGGGADRPILRRGARGDDVRELQRLLNQLDYLSDSIDGIFGRGTQRAVRDFQRDQGLSADGIVGRQTWQALYRAAGDEPDDTTPGGTTPSEPSDPPPFENRPSLRRGSRGDDVRELQRLLIAAGHLPQGGDDGIFGSGTRRAVQNFQRAQGLTADGIVGQQTWQALYVATGEWDPSSSETDHNASDPGSDNWWDDDSWEDEDWWEESERRVETHRDEKQAAEVMRNVVDAAGSLLRDGRGQLVLPGGTQTEAGGQGGVSVHALGNKDNGGLAAAVQSVARMSMREALQRLMRQWDSFGAAQDGEFSRRRAAVIVVGAGTQVSSDDLRALRRLALHGDLYLVSHYGPVLRFLSQRLHMVRGVHYRQTTQTRMAQTLRSVVAEAAGGQDLLLRTDQTETDDAIAYRYGFHLTELDQRVVIEFATNASAKVIVKPPDNDPISLTTRSRRVGLRLVNGGEFLQVVLENTANRFWSGFWEIRLMGMETQPEAQGWVWSTLSLEFQKFDDWAGRPRVENTGKPRRRMFSLSGNNGDVQLRQMRVEETTIGAVEVSESERRPVNVQVPVSRLDRGNMHMTEAGGGTVSNPTSPQLDGRMRSKKEKDKPSIVALNAKVAGVSPEGWRFDRQVYGNIFNLIPRRNWRLARRQRQGARFISARVVGIRYAADGQISGLMLQHGHGRKRPVRVVHPTLRLLLADTEMKGADFHFFIRGDRVDEVLRILQP